MSSKKKFSRLRLRSQPNNVNSRNKPTTVISHYFKRPSSESDESVPSTSEISPKDDGNNKKFSSAGIIDIPNSVKVNSNKTSPKLRTKSVETQKLLNLSDDLSDFSTPKPIKRVIPKIFEPKFKPKPVPKRNKKQVANKKITEASRKFLYESKDYNQEHLHLAIALSKSIQDFENPGHQTSQPSCSADNELTPTQENVLEIRKKLTKFQYKNTDAFPQQNEDVPIKATKSKKGRNHPFMSILVRRTIEDRENIIQRKLSTILLAKAKIDCEKQFYSDFKICDTLEKYKCDAKVLFKKAELCGEEDENFYTNQLVTPTTAKCGNLLRDWSKILGRETTPPREIVNSKKECNKTIELKISNSNLSPCTEFEQNMEVDKTSLRNENILEKLEISKQNTKEVDKSSGILGHPDLSTSSCIELNVEIPKILVENPFNVNSTKSEQTNSKLLEKHSIDSTKSETVIPDVNKNISIRSLTPDLFSESEDEILYENPAANRTFTIQSKLDDNVSKMSRPPIEEEEVLDLTQSSNSEKIVDLSQSSGKESDDQNVEDNYSSDKSNDSLFDLPEFDIKYTITKSKNDQEIVKNGSLIQINDPNLNKSLHQTTFNISLVENDCQMLVDLSQSSNSNDHDFQGASETPKKNQSFDGSNSSGSKNISNNHLADETKIIENSVTESRLNTNLNLLDLSMNFENYREMRVDLSQSLDDSDDNCSQQMSINRFATETPTKRGDSFNRNSSKDSLSPMINTSNEHLTENSTPKSRLNCSDFKSKSFIDANQIRTNTSLRKFNSFEENCSKDEENLNSSELTEENSMTPKSRLSDFVRSNTTFSILKNHSFNESRISRKIIENTPKSTSPSVSNCRLKRKSKSFINENQLQSHNTTLRKFNSFVENFDYELETSLHISLNANKPNNSESNGPNLDSNGPNLDSQTETDDDSLIVISDDELNYSCSTPYRKVKSEKSFRTVLLSKKSSSSTSSLNESLSKSPIRNGSAQLKCPDSINVSQNCMVPLESPSRLKETDSIDLSHNFTNQLESPSKCPIDNRETNSESPKTTSLPTNISLLLGDSFVERELRRTTSLWDRVCGKKPIETIKSKTPQIQRKSLVHFETPTTQLEIKTHDVTPMPNYDEMRSPDIRKELDKYGLKSLKRRRAAQILKYIYEQTHPLDGGDETYSDTEDCNHQQAKRAKCRPATKLDSFIPVELSTIEIVGDLLSKNCSESDLIFETRQSSKIASCRLPFHIAWHNYVSENPEIRLKILKYFPIQLEEICVHFKEMGFKYHVNDILSFLDKKCITIRTNQNSHRNKKATNTKK